MLFFEGMNRTLLLQRQSDFIKSIQQAFATERINIERNNLTVRLLKPAVSQGQPSD